MSLTLLRLRNLPLKGKMTFVILVTCSTVLMLACAALFTFQFVSIENRFQHDLSDLGDIVANTSAAAVAFQDEAAAAQMLGALQGRSDILGARLVLADGKQLASFGPNWDEHSPPATNVRSTQSLEDELLVSSPVQLDDRHVGTLQVRADFRSARNALLKLYGGILTIVLLVSLLIAFALSSRLQPLITGPIDRLIATTQEIAKGGDYSIRAETPGTDEVRTLATAFNSMLDKVQAQDEALQAARSGLEKRVEERTHELREQILERHRTEEERDRFFTLPLGLLCTTDMKGHFKRLNPAFEGVLGFTSEDLQGASFDKIVFPGAEAIDFEELIKLTHDHETTSFEIRCRCKDGSDRWIVWAASPVPHLGLVYASGRDITERKRAEEELRWKTALLEAQMEFSLDGVLMVDAAGRHIIQNRVLNELWKIPPGIILEGQEEAQMKWVTAMTQNPEEFVKKVEYLYAHPDETSRDEIELKDGTALDRYSSPVRGKAGEYYGRLWTFRDITDRKRAEMELAKTHSALLMASRQAGMAEVATNVLHNVGNVLNSVNVSAEAVAGRVKQFRVGSLKSVATLLLEHAHDLPAFLSRDPKGRELPAYLVTLSQSLAAPQQAILEEIGSLKRNIEHIKEVVATQQSYARRCGVFECFGMAELVEDAIRINSTGLIRHEVKVVRDFHQVPSVVSDRHKVLQILVNLMANAKNALAASGPDRQMVLRIEPNTPDRVVISVSDNGEGIPPENLNRIFQHGFTTRKDGHGFGLHSGALAARELGGKLTAHSDGAGKGATFTLELPVQITTIPS